MIYDLIIRQPMSIIKRALISVGLILTGLMVGQVDLHPSLHALQTYQSEIFYTNCLILFTKQQINIESPLPAVPPECAVIEWALPAGLIASGIIMLLFGFNKTSVFFTMGNLAAYLALYCNTRIDSSFGVYAHALEALACLLGVAYLYIKQSEAPKENKRNF